MQLHNPVFVSTESDSVLQLQSMYKCWKTAEAQLAAFSPPSPQQYIFQAPWKSTLAKSLQPFWLCAPQGRGKHASTAHTKLCSPLCYWNGANTCLVQLALRDNEALQSWRCHALKFQHKTAVVVRSVAWLSLDTKFFCIPSSTLLTFPPAF